MQSGGWAVTTAPKPRKPAAAQLSDDELRRRILANTAVLFPSASPAPGESSPYEIVYATKPRPSSQAEEPPFQYSMVVRRNRSGGYTPLIKGQMYSSTAPWSMVLQGLLDTTATLIHSTIGQAPMPQLGILENVPPYAPPSPQSPLRQ